MVVTANEYPGGAPSAETPVRRRASLRRTTTHDSARPDGLLGPVVMVASGRDLLTRADGSAQVLDAARLDVTAQYLEGIVTAISAQPDHAGIAKLAGARIHGGFRKAVEEVLPGESTSRGVRFQLLDELPAALLQSGRALRVAKIAIGGKGRSAPVDICSGWAAGGSAIAGFSELGPPLNIGPTAPALATPNDPLAWHETTPLPLHGTRRARRLDLWAEKDRIWVESFFRDSHVDGDGLETIVHEWTLMAEFDPVTRRFLSGDAKMGPLPFPECPGAAASAGRLAGMPTDGLRRAVKSAFVGPSTCTHLNDTLRSMEDVGALLDALRAHETLPG